MKKTFLILLGVVCIIILAMAFFTKNKEETPPPGGNLATTTLSWSEGSFIVEIADTPTTRAQGLSGREKLLKNHGMLFVFPEDNFYSFWMKDMNFPIDILWLNSDFRVVHIVSAAAPETYPSSFVPPVPARYVLEISANESTAKGIVVGTQFVPPTL